MRAVLVEKDADAMAGRFVLGVGYLELNDLDEVSKAGFERLWVLLATIRRSGALEQVRAIEDMAFAMRATTRLIGGL